MTHPIMDDALRNALQARLAASPALVALTDHGEGPAPGIFVTLRAGLPCQMQDEAPEVHEERITLSVNAKRGIKAQARLRIAEAIRDQLDDQTLALDDAHQVELTLVALSSRREVMSKIERTDLTYSLQRRGH